MRVAVAALMLGMTPGAMAQQPPPIDPPTSFMVFFDWGKGELRSDDGAVLDKVAETFRAHPSAHLTLNGHSDRSGSTATNRRTALSRAETIRTELEKRGIPRNAMSATSFGEAQPLVPTEDGVREVQNRRVVIEMGE